MIAPLFVIQFPFSIIYTLGFLGLNPVADWEPSVWSLHVLLPPTCVGSLQVLQIPHANKKNTRLG